VSITPSGSKVARKPALGTALAWRSVTTGNLAGIDIRLEEARRGCGLSGEVDLRALMTARGPCRTAPLHPNTRPFYANSAAQEIKGRLNSGF
jgi:hypothetical protein